MAKIPEKYFRPLPPLQKVVRNEFRTDNFVAKSPSKNKNNFQLPSKIESKKEDLDGGFPVIKASEGPVIVTFGGIQLVVGILMIAFGILTTLHEASMSAVGAGFWGGAMGITNGFVGIIAGFKGCYKSADRISPLAVTVYLALCLVAIGVSNLAMVLTATGLLRDSQRPDYFLPLKSDEYEFIQISSSNRTNWAPVLANIGLLIITSVECLTTIAAAFRCYWFVCRCKRRRTSLNDRANVENDINYRYDSPDITTASYCSSNRSKQKLVRRWLGQQSIVNHPTSYSVPFSSTYSAIPPYYYTLSTIDGKIIYPSNSLVSHSDYSYMLPNIAEPYCMKWPKVSLSPQKSHRNPVQDRTGSGTRLRSKQPERRYSSDEILREKSDSVTEEDIDKTYTGLDREIAEEFISVAMEPKRH